MATIRPDRGWFLLFLLCLMSAFGEAEPARYEADAAIPTSAAAEPSDEPAVPENDPGKVPAQIRQLMQDREYDKAVAAIDELRRDGDVLVCCGLGYSRSATAVVAWLVASGNAASIDEAVAIVRHARPKVVLRQRHLAVVEHWLTSASRATP